MRCQDFLALHSDFRDGIITDPSMERRMRRHQARCATCSHYVDALEVGTRVLREFEVEPSPRFRVNLRVRMALAARRRRTAPPVFGWPARAAATALVVTAVVTVVIQRNDREAETSQSAPRVVAAAPESTAVPLTRPAALPGFRPRLFHEPSGNAQVSAPRVTFSMSEDSGFRAIPATFSR